MRPPPPEAAATNRGGTGLATAEPGLRQRGSNTLTKMNYALHLALGKGDLYIQTILPSVTNGPKEGYKEGWSERNNRLWICEAPNKNCGHCFI